MDGENFFGAGQLVSPVFLMNNKKEVASEWIDKDIVDKYLALDALEVIGRDEYETDQPFIFMHICCEQELRNKDN